ncbi:SH3 domain-containing protein [Ekhidna sp.]
MIYRIKVRLFLGILFCCQLSALIAQNDVLIKADSLFSLQKYTEAFTEYQQIFNENQTSASMLLKMAFIQDGLGNYTEALFYLDHYYQKSANREVIGKIEELAEENELSGYTYNDVDYFVALHTKYRNSVALALISLIVLFSVYIVIKRKENQTPIAAVVIQGIVILALFAVINFKRSKEGIIVSDQTLLRSGPSAGGEPIDFIEKGHKVKVLSVDQAWAKISWDGREVYVRNSRIRLI